MREEVLLELEKLSPGRVIERAALKQRLEIRKRRLVLLIRVKLGILLVHGSPLA